MYRHIDLIAFLCYYLYMSAETETVTFRDARRDDIDFLRRMCRAAVFEMVGQNLPAEEVPTVEEAMTEHELGVFVDGFGRDGDYGLIAQKNGENIGAAWYRHYERDSDEPPYELSIALKGEHTGNGIGPELINGLMQHAASEDIDVMSLQVHIDNEAGRKAYDRLGFKPIREVDEHGYVLMTAPTAPFAELK